MRTPDRATFAAGLPQPAVRTGGLVVPVDDREGHQRPRWLSRNRNERLGERPDARGVAGSRYLDYSQTRQNARHPGDGLQVAVVLADDGQHRQRDGAPALSRNLVERRQTARHCGQHVGGSAREQRGVERSDLIVRRSVASGGGHCSNEGAGVPVLESVRQRRHLRCERLQVLTLPSGTEQRGRQQAIRVPNQELFDDTPPIE